MFLCGVMCLFLWQASIYPVMGNGSDSRVLLPYDATKDETKSVPNVKTTTTLVIQRGDTLWDISSKYQTTVNELVTINQFKSSHQIREGQLIKVPKQQEIVRSQDRFPMGELVKTQDPYPYPRYSMPNPEDVSEKVSGITIEQNVSNMPWWEIVLQKISFFAFTNKSKPVTHVSSTIHPSHSDEEIKVYEVFVNKDIAEEPTQKLSISELANINDDRSKLANNQPSSENQIHSRGLGRFVTQEEVELLSRVIHGEARGENFEGQVAVGAVVLNRLKDPRFPKTLQTVVYQSGQFTAVKDKQIYLDPNEQSYKAAEAALSGLDPTDGAIFYYNPSIATDQWIKTRPVIKRIGNHTFSI